MQVLFALTNGVFRVLLARKPVIVPAKVDYLKQNMPLMRADNILETLINDSTQYLYTALISLPCPVKLSLLLLFTKLFLFLWYITRT